LQWVLRENQGSKENGIMLPILWIKSTSTIFKFQK
jgi:hypothetical protein